MDIRNYCQKSSILFRCFCDVYATDKNCTDRRAYIFFGQLLLYPPVEMKP